MLFSYFSFTKIMTFKTLFLEIKACENGNGGCSQLCRKKEGGQLYCECFNGYLLHGTSCVG